jgi:hypothetical protein
MTDDAKDDDEPPIRVKLSDHHKWNMAFDESRRFGTATASVALVDPLWYETEPEKGTIRFYYPTADGKVTRFVAQPGKSPDEWTLRTAFPDDRASRRFRRKLDDGTE